MSFREQLLLNVTDKLIIGVLLLLAGWWINEKFELFKSAEQQRNAETSVRIGFIDRQLSEFYWPILFRLERDNAVWEKLMDADKRFARAIETDVILPNHNEILRIIDTHADLIFNSWESSEPALVDAIKQYERHLAVYKALRASGDSRMPIDVKEPWPDQFYTLMKRRVTQLQAQRVKIVTDFRP